MQLFHLHQQITLSPTCTQESPLSQSCVGNRWCSMSTTPGQLHQLPLQWPSLLAGRLGGNAQGTSTSQQQMRAGVCRTDHVRHPPHPAVRGQGAAQARPQVRVAVCGGGAGQRPDPASAVLHARRREGPVLRPQAGAAPAQLGACLHTLSTCCPAPALLQSCAKSMAESAAPECHVPGLPALEEGPAWLQALCADASHVPRSSIARSGHALAEGYSAHALPESLHSTCPNRTNRIKPRSTAPTLWVGCSMCSWSAAPTTPTCTWSMTRPTLCSAASPAWL